MSTKNDLKLDSVNLDICTDARLSGWDAFSNAAHGWWNNSLKKQHINFLGLQATFKSLLNVANNSKKPNIFIRKDITTAQQNE